ncbi:DUF5010 C-terminal domain-containing protein [Kibdelosporangium philippinense]|uniref:DUF5010 C-terminal domain-containing protein n=1 Tax=Kibdelosporangium philippinense TaxID=211113 RepID=A0ABS8Z3N0_9PSEU|nr:carbohydrate-binding domain-containing protein [Kibdelosporangium philippinense]MCE7002539.1 DUF5010 C-terminal domain-containing protein [Kibdelosporangium philippinense]
MPLNTRMAGQATFRFVMDGNPGPVITINSPGYQTLDAGTFTLDANSYHPVRLEFLTGSMNIDYWTN